MLFNSCDVCQACDEMGVDYSKNSKGVKVIKSVDKAHPKGKR